MLGRFKSVQSRFFVVFLPPLLVVTAAVIVLHGYLASETLQDEFFRKQEEIIFNNSIALVEPMAKNDLKRVKRVLEIITTDPDVIHAEVKDLSDKTVAEVGLKGRIPKKFIFKASGVITDVIAKDADWEVLGTLDIVFSKQRILNSIRERIIENAILVSSLAAIIILGVYLFLRFFVQKPLKRLTDPMVSAASEGVSQSGGVSGAADFETATSLCEALLNRIDGLEQDVKTRERILRAALETSPAGVVIATRDGKGLFCNSRYAEQYGGTREEVLSINPRLNYADSKDRDRLYRRLSEDGRVDAMDIRMRRKDGSLWWARCTWRPIEFEGVQGHIGWMVETERPAAAAEAARHRH